MHTWLMVSKDVAGAVGFVPTGMDRWICVCLEIKNRIKICCEKDYVTICSFFITGKCLGRGAQGPSLELGTFCHGAYCKTTLTRFF